MSEMLTPDAAVALTRAVWDSRREEMLRYLTKERPKKFSQSGALACIGVFIETQIFVAEQTGEPQLGAKL